MGFFTSNYDKEGPGVSPDEPRRKGVARFLEVCSRDIWSFFKAGLLAFVSLIPFMAGLGYAVQSRVLLAAVLSGAIGGLIAAPQIFGVADTLLRSLRDEPGYWWSVYCRAWRHNLRISLLPGTVLGFIAAVQIFALYNTDGLESPLLDLAGMCLGSLLVLGLAGYLISQLVLMELPLYGALYNSVLLFLGYLPRSVGAALLQLIYFALIILYVPKSLAIFAVCSFWLPMLLAYLVIYPVLDRQFKIEESVNKLHEEKRTHI